MTYRNRALLDLCHEAPCLLLPGQHECLGMPAEPCHSDMIRHGRGEHHKSHDCFAVPGCHNAHLAFTRANLGKDGYHAAWVEAIERYILWQWVTGKVRLADITQRPKESTMEAPMCKICETRHYVRDPHQFGKDAPRGLGIPQSESRGEGARRRLEKSTRSGASGKAKANTDTAEAPRRTPTPTEANGRETGSETHIPAGGSTGSGCSPGPIPAATAARGRVTRASKGKSAARRARTKAKKKGKKKCGPGKSATTSPR